MFQVTLKEEDEVLVRDDGIKDGAFITKAAHEN